MRNDIAIRPETQKDYKNIISLVLRSFKEGTSYSDGTDIIALIEEIRIFKYYIPELSFLTLGIEKVKELDFKGITVEGDFHFYNRIGFKTSSQYKIYPTSGYPMSEPRCMMCQETFEGSLEGIQGYIVYDMYCNA